MPRSPREQRPTRLPAADDREVVPARREERPDGRREGRDRAIVPADARIAEVAGHQRGIITATQLRAAGLTTSAIGRRVERGLLHRLHRGVYAVGHLADIPLAAEQAALFACGPGAALSHRSAAAFYKLLPAPSRPDVSVPPGRDPRPEGVTVHRPGTLGEAWTREGLRVTSPRQTLVDLAPVVGAADLARAVNEAHVQALVHPKNLTIPAGRPGAARMRAVLGVQRRGKTRSGVERQFLRLVESAGLPPPETNVRVAGVEVDALWREQQVAVEIDTYWTHGAAAPRRRDPQRDLALRRAGLDPVRITDEQLDDTPVAVAVMLATLLR